MQIDVRQNFEVKNLTTFKIGGKITCAYFPTNIDEFVEVLALEPDALVFGNLSNTLVSTDGYNGAVILTTKMSEIIFDGNFVKAHCGVKGPLLSKKTAEKGLSGLEFMIGFPGSVGGEVCMNASAHGQALCDYLKTVTLFSNDCGVFVLSNEEMKFDYRTSICHSEPFVVLSAEFELMPKKQEEIEQKMSENLAFRKSHQPSLTLPNCGSVFKNPEGHSAGRLLDEVGAKSLSVGGARVWENHANFIVNDKGGTSEDVLKLMFEMYSMVKDKFNIELEPEVRFLGGNNENEVKLCKILYQE